MDPLTTNYQPAPDFTLADLSGEPHSLSDYRGQVVVLNFWSAACPWAVRADTALMPLLRSLRGRVSLLSIASNANELLEQLAEAAIVRRVPIVLRDTDRNVADHYRAQTTPHFYIIDADGVLRYQGAFDDVTFRRRVPSQNYLKQALEAVLLGNRPNPDQDPPYGCTLVRYS